MLTIMAVVLFMLAVSFFCSIGEAALYAVPPARVEALRAKGSPAGLRLSLLRDRIERPISAILFLNTFANTMGAAIAGALVGAAFHPEYVLPFSLVLTMAVLLFAEIIPKSLGVGYSRKLAPRLAWSIQALVYISWPFVRLGEALAGFFSPRGGKSGPSEDEIIALARLGVRDGKILPEEGWWIKNILRLNDITASEMMTPRPVMTTLVGSRLVSDIAAEIPSLQHSRIPVTSEEGPDHILGFVLRRELVDACITGLQEKRVEELAHKTLFVPAATRGHQLLSFFIESKTHLAIVVDEYGGTMGLVTLEDVIETMLGTQIIDEFDPHPDMREYARSRAAEKVEKPGE